MSKKNLNKVSKPSLLVRIKNLVSESKPVFIFVGVFILLMVLFYVLWLSPWFTNHINPKITSLNAWISAKLLHLFGQAASSNGQIIFSSAFSISVARGCDGVEAMAIFSSAIIAFPLPWKRKLYGVLLGVSLLFLLNVVRIVSLFLVGVHYPSIFELMHVEVWQGIFILVSVGMWLGWITTSSKKRANA